MKTAPSSKSNCWMDPMTPHSRLLSSLSIFPSTDFLHSYLLHHTLSFLLLQLHFVYGFYFLHAFLPLPTPRLSPLLSKLSNLLCSRIHIPLALTHLILKKKMTRDWTLNFCPALGHTSALRLNCPARKALSLTLSPSPTYTSRSKGQQLANF